MSKVTINNLMDLGLEPCMRDGQFAQVEIVPRKMIEMIIKYCEDQEAICLKHAERAWFLGHNELYRQYTNVALGFKTTIRYINKLLAEFEEESIDQNDTSCKKE